MDYSEIVVPPTTLVKTVETVRFVTHAEARLYLHRYRLSIYVCPDGTIWMGNAQVAAHVLIGTPLIKVRMLDAPHLTGAADDVSR